MKAAGEVLKILEQIEHIDPSEYTQGVICCPTCGEERPDHWPWCRLKMAMEHVERYIDWRERNCLIK